MQVLHCKDPCCDVVCHDREQILTGRQFVVQTLHTPNRRERTRVFTMYCSGMFSVNQDNIRVRSITVAVLFCITV